MPRFARVVAEGSPHHITQRGNERRDVFFTAADRDVYLGLLGQYSALHELAVLGYCLMTNHVHLVAVPRRPNSLARVMREVQMRYSQYRHAIERGSGHLWQCRYYSQLDHQMQPMCSNHRRQRQPSRALTDRQTP